MLRDDGMSTLSVVVPTYRRPQQLHQCLTGLAGQTAAPDDLIVVHRPEDEDSARVVDVFPFARAVLVHESGVLQAMEAGARETSTEIIAFIDDDAVPSRDWVRRLREPFEDETVGAVGGKDLVWEAGVPLESAEYLSVGVVTRWGGHIGNHHLGTGEARTTDVVKGVNMAWRRSALAFPLGLAGSGAQPHYEIAMAAWARARGFRLLYDPRITVDHYPGERFDEDGRNNRTAGAISNEAYNLSLATMAWSHTNRFRVTVRGILLGEASTPGLGRWTAGRLGLVSPARGLVPTVAGRVRGALARQLAFRSVIG
jgi:glycosyltransferase involved in cell wall biosynthesis